MKKHYWWLFWIAAMTLMALSSCKKEYPDHRRLSDGTHVWIKWQNWNSDKAAGLDVHTEWIIDGITPESNNAFYAGQLNFYSCHNNHYPRRKVNFPCNPNYPDSVKAKGCFMDIDTLVVLADDEVQTNGPSHESLFNKIIH